MEADNNKKQNSSSNSAMNNMIHFTPKQKTSIIKVIGVGGGGSNAVNYMFKQGIEGVDFVVCNTDLQALTASSVPVKVQLGESGLGAGSDPGVAQKAAIDSLEKLKAVIDDDTEMVFITAGMGGGTGTGAAPVIAKFAREQGLLSVGIVTLPFRFEGRRKMLKAKQGILEIRKYVDTLLVINNDILRELYPNLGLANAFSQADNVLATAAKGIAELITVHGYVNVDFEDVKTVMKDSGKAIMGSAITEGDDRALKAIEEAMTSPLLNDNDVYGAKNILLYITTGVNDVTMDEITAITDYIAERCGEESANVIWGRGIDEEMGDKLGITIIATGFPDKEDNDFKEETKKITKTPLYGDADKKFTNQQVPSDNNVPDDVNKNSEIYNEQTAKEKPDISTKPELDIKKEKKVFSLDDPINEKKNSEEHIVNEPSGHDNYELPFDSSDTIKMHIKPANPVMPKKEQKTEPETLDNQQEELEKHATERINKLKALSMSLSEMEKPAYLRKNVQLSNPNYSKDSEVSRFSLSEDSHKKPFIKSDNSFLHDNVD